MMPSQRHGNGEVVATQSLSLVGLLWLSSQRHGNGEVVATCARRPPTCRTLEVTTPWQRRGCCHQYIRFPKKSNPGHNAMATARLLPHNPLVARTLTALRSQRHGNGEVVATCDSDGRLPSLRKSQRHGNGEVVATQCVFAGSTNEDRSQRHGNGEVVATSHVETSFDFEYQVTTPWQRRGCCHEAVAVDLDRMLGVTTPWQRRGCCHCSAKRRPGLRSSLSQRHGNGEVVATEGFAAIETRRSGHNAMATARLLPPTVSPDELARLEMSQRHGNGEVVATHRDRRLRRSRGSHNAMATARLLPHAYLGPHTLVCIVTTPWQRRGCCHVDTCSKRPTSAGSHIKTSPKTLNNAQRHPAEVRKLNEGPPARSVADRSARGRSLGSSSTGGRDLKGGAQ